MLYLYLDESGDLGFDFVNHKPSVYFTVCVLAVKGRDNDCRLAALVKSAMRRLRIYGKGAQELKGNNTSMEAKRLFYDRVKSVEFKLYAVTMNKKKLCGRLSEDKDRFYNYIARLALERVDFRDAAVRVIMTVDKSKTRQAIAEFNRYILSQIKARIDPLVPLDIFHMDSAQSPNLQAADLFAWGIFRRYERADLEWYDRFRPKLREDRLYLP